MKRIVFVLVSVLLYYSCFPAHSQAAQSDAAFHQLLQKLDRAPFDYKSADAAAQRGNQIQQYAGMFTAISKRAEPGLIAISDSKTLALLSHIPYIGTPIKITTLAMGSFVEINRGFSVLVDQDRKMVQPLRNAVVATAKLKRSRNRRDLPSAVNALDAALPSLQNYENQVNRQYQLMTSLSSILEKVAPYATRYGHMPEQGQGSMAQIQKDMVRITGSFRQSARAVHELTQYTEECDRDGHLAMGTTYGAANAPNQVVENNSGNTLSSHSRNFTPVSASRSSLTGFNLPQPAPSQSQDVANDSAVEVTSANASNEPPLQSNSPSAVPIPEKNVIQGADAGEISASTKSAEATDNGDASSNTDSASTQTTSLNTSGTTISPGTTAPNFGNDTAVVVESTSTASTSHFPYGFLFLGFATLLLIGSLYWWHVSAPAPAVPLVSISSSPQSWLEGSPEFVGRRFPLPSKGRIIIGRSAYSDVCSNDARTSSRHAEIICSETSYLLADLDSTNGTFVNGHRIERTLLSAGDKIQVGQSQLIFRQRKDV